MPTVPVSVWEQIPVVIVFAFLLAGIAWFMVREFTKAVASINAYYVQMVESNNAQFSKSLIDNNGQWQKYFDARSATNKLVDDQMVEKLEKLTGVIQTLVSDFERHDQMERQYLDAMGNKHSLSKRRNLS